MQAWVAASPAQSAQVVASGSGRGDQPALGLAAAAVAAVAQRGGVAGVADRPLGPVRARAACPGRSGRRPTLRRGAHLVQIGASVPAKPQGRRRPQPAQMASGSWKQPSQMSGWSPWARRAIRRVRPHRPHSRCGRSAQRAQTGRRSLSRPATGLMTPQRAHACGELAASAAGANPTGGRAGQRQGALVRRPRSSAPAATWLPGPVTPPRADRPPAAPRSSTRLGRRSTPRPGCVARLGGPPPPRSRPRPVGPTGSGRWPAPRPRSAGGAARSTLTDGSLSR